MVLSIPAFVHEWFGPVVKHVQKTEATYSEKEEGETEGLMFKIYTMSLNLCTAGINVGCLGPKRESRSLLQLHIECPEWVVYSMLACSCISFIALQHDIIHSPQAQHSFLPEFVQTWERLVTSLGTLFCIPNTSRPVYYLTQQHSSPLLNSAKGSSSLIPSKRKLCLRRKGKF